MPSETIEIPISLLNPYPAGATFFSAIAYPSPLDKTERNHFFLALIRWALLKKTALNPDWAKSLQLVAPIYFAQADKQFDQSLKRGLKRLADRLTMAQFIAFPVLRKIITNKPQVVKGFDATVDNMALLAAQHMGMSENSQVTIKDKKWKPSKPVIHGACAYVIWETLLSDELGDRRKVDKMHAFLTRPELVEDVVDIAEYVQEQLATTKQFKIGESINFRSKRVDAAELNGEQ